MEAGYQVKLAQNLLLAWFHRLNLPHFFVPAI
jgi:hypothetical protein